MFLPRRISIHRPMLRRPNRSPSRSTVLLCLVASWAALATTTAVSQAAVPTSAGQLYAFGENQFGELGNTTGNGADEAHPTPTLVTLPGAGGPVTEVSVGVVHSLAVTSSGQLFSFGSNMYGQLGRTAGSGTPDANPTPAVVDLPDATGPVTRVAAGGWDSFAVTSTGQLFAFGENVYGQLGDSTNIGTGNANPTPVLVAMTGASGPVTEVAAGVNHTLVVTASGQLFAFGENGYGQLGTYTDFEAFGAANPTPTLVGLPGANGPVVEVAAGVRDSLALTSTGQLFAFGGNAYGELANANYAATPIPTLVSLPGATGPVTQIAAGAYYNLALTSTGQLFAFGENCYGELGNPFNNGNGTPNPNPEVVTIPGAAGPVIQIAGGEISSLAITASGQLFTFGENRYGQLGTPVDAGTENANPIPSLVSQPEGNTIDEIAQGSSAWHALEVVSDLAVLNSSLPSGQVSTSYAAAAQAAGGSAPYAWSASGLPPGLSINSSTGQISGTPTSPANASVVLTVTDARGVTATSALALTISSPPSPAPAPPARPVVSVRQFEMYFEARRRGDRLHLINIVVVSLTPGEHVSYTCEGCGGRHRRATRYARRQKLTFSAEGLIVGPRSRLKVVVTAKNGTRRVRVYGFKFGRLPHAVLKEQKCFAPGIRNPISCQL
jgi:alpha-tubulin suppressor-like RCC1 family protein